MEEKPRYRRLFVGTYTDDCESDGIYTLEFDERTRSLRVLHASAQESNPSFVVRRGRYLYVAHEIPDYGCIAAYEVNEDGSLSLSDAYKTSGDSETCSLLIHPDGTCIYGSNYRSGSISCCALKPDGQLGEEMPSERHVGNSVDPVRQSSPHVHSTSFVPNTRWLMAVDLGMDALVMYCTSETGRIQTPPLEIIDVPAGSGPRMVAYHPTQPLAAVINELANDVLVCSFDETGRCWKLIDRLELPLLKDSEGAEGDDEDSDDVLAAHLAFSDDGTRLYASVRGDDSLVVFSLDDACAPLQAGVVSSGGRGPRHFSLSPDGTFLAVADQDDGRIVVFSVDRETGMPDEVARIDVPQAACVIWDQGTQPN